MIDDYCYVPLETFKRIFGMPQALFEDIYVWTHEFTEDSIVNVLRNIDKPLFESCKYFDLSGGDVTTIHHVLTSLSCISLLNDKIVGPETFWWFLKNHSLSRKVRI